MEPDGRIEDIRFSTLKRSHTTQKSTEIFIQVKSVIEWAHESTIRKIRHGQENLPIGLSLHGKRLSGNYLYSSVCHKGERRANVVG